MFERRNGPSVALPTGHRASYRTVLHLVLLLALMGPIRQLIHIEAERAIDEHLLIWVRKTSAFFQRRPPHVPQTASERITPTTIH